MDHSMLIARFLGIIFVIYGLALICNGKKFKAARESVKNCAGLSWVIGMCQLFWGSLLIVTQEVWMGWMTIVTVAGWVIFLMGVMRLWCCRCPAKCHADQKSGSESCDAGCSKGKCCFAMVGLIALVWGAAMLYYGFFGGDMNNVIVVIHHIGQ